MLESFRNVFNVPELQKRILFTVAILIVYRMGAHVPTPGVDGQALSDFFARQQGTILGFIDMFSGGALARLTIFALGIMPYISASIILELLTVVFPTLEKLKKEGGEQGRKKITQYTRYGTVLISFVQGLGISIGLESMTSPDGVPIVLLPGWSFRLMTVLTLTAGTVFLMWLGEQITERGIGNGISLIIFAGIVTDMPSAFINTLRLAMTGEMGPLWILVLFALMALVVGWIVFMEAGHRKIPIQYAKKVVGRRMYGGQSTHLPLKVNTSGVIPPIFASSVIMFPATIAQFSGLPWLQGVANYLLPGTFIYELLFVTAIFFFCYFYTAIIFNPVDVADNMKKYGGFIPGIRPGKRTAEYIDRTLTRITVWGAAYLSAVCVLPSILLGFNPSIPFYFGGTSLLIVVGVAMDTMQQVESHLVMRHYEGFIKKGRLRGRRG
ncbi:MAG: preprotein translocase subunit SecY [Candidatus Tectomicrobia bacterium]|uniref:Protein translocase subunit SecY n=1 Tax=Tectimicrobiota bacterium TaxID=2528274 RepID=A0A932FZN4_UNCTE|nr:preprotein translocase subunit SecY [Candidatus Tectomicrobia bacterium]